MFSSKKASSASSSGDSLCRVIVGISLIIDE
jgi:hypothetical protein